MESAAQARDDERAMPPSNELTPELAARRDRLLAILRSLGSVAVAFSGGIDSTVVAQAAFRPWATGPSP